MNARYLSLVCAAALLGLPLTGMSRDTSKPTAATGAAAVSEQIKALAAMSGPERRTAMKKLSRAERRDLWAQIRHLRTEKGFNPLHIADGISTKKGQYRNSPKRSIAGKAGDKWKRTKAVGTIQYDSGSIDTAFGGGERVGNRFNTHTGVPVVASGTVSAVQAVVVPGPASPNTTGVATASFVILGPQTTMGGANALMSDTTAVSGTVDTITFTGLGVTYTGGSFFVLGGDFASAYILPMSDSVSVNGQGFHGLVGYSGGAFPNITGTFDLGGFRNGLVRATGNIVPVELMNFSVD